MTRARFCLCMFCTIIITICFIHLLHFFVSYCILCSLSLFSKHLFKRRLQAGLCVLVSFYAVLLIPGFIERVLSY